MTLTLAAAAALSLASPAAAQQPGQPAAHPVTRAEFVAKIDQTFNSVDANHDGSLSASEIQAEQTKEVERIRAAVEVKLRAAFTQLDTNKDGQLSFAEYAAQASGFRSSDTPAQVLQKLDTNHDGKLSAAEFRASKLPMFDKADLNHDGTVTPDEERRANAQK